MEAVSGGLDDVIYSVPFWVSIIVVSVLPAICEEAVHRGVIIHTMYRIRKEWLVVLIMGIYFGLSMQIRSFPAHGDPGRSHVIYYAGDGKYGLFLRISYGK